MARPNHLRQPSANYLGKNILDRVILFVGCLVFVGAFAIVSHLAFFGYAKFPPNFQFLGSLVVSYTAISFAAYFLWSVRNVPGPHPYFLPLYILTIMFFIMFAAVLLLRLDYSRVVLFSSFISSLVWFQGFALRDRGRRAVVLGYFEGNVEPVDVQDQVEWLPIKDHLAPMDNIDFVVFSGDAIGDFKRQLSELSLRDIPLITKTDFLEIYTGRISLDQGELSLIRRQLDTSRYVVVKALLDKIMALLFLPILLPVLALCWIAIKLDDGGPLLFAQTRVGRFRQEFTLYKIRTMVDDNRVSFEAAHTQDRDQRVTVVGSVLRKTRIDELPQVINILKGEMSWIGPRPHPSVMSERYQARIQAYGLRYLVPPGITGWAQVNQGHVNTLEAVKIKTSYDLYYAKHLSIRLDLIIAVRTLGVMVLGLGSR